MDDRRPQNVLMEIGLRLRKARLILNLTQRDLCKQLHVATNTYNQWEKGRSLCDPLVAVRFAKLYDVTLDYLYLGSLSGLPHHLAQKILGTPQTPVFQASFVELTSETPLPAIAKENGPGPQEPASAAPAAAKINRKDQAWLDLIKNMTPDDQKAVRTFFNELAQQETRIDVDHDMEDVNVA